MGWKDVPDSQQSEKIPAGTYDKLRFIRVVRGPKNGLPFTSQGGDPQIMLITADDQDREAPVMITLSDKAAWKLKSYLVAIGADLDAMDRDGVDHRNFADEMFATAQLCDRPFRGEVSWAPGKNSNSGKLFADVVPIRPRPEAKPDDGIPI